MIIQSGKALTTTRLPILNHQGSMAALPSSSAQNWSTPRNAGAIAKKVKSLNSHMIYYVSHILLYIMICCYMMYVTLRV